MIRVLQHLDPAWGVDFEKSHSLVLQDSLRRLRRGHFLDVIGLRF
jgi:hypothetical protein